MKLSTIFIIATAVVSLGMLTAYNFSLKASYQKGGYKNRFNEMEFSQAKGLKEVRINSANRLVINVEKGAKEGLWISNRIKGLVKVGQAGTTLTIDLTDEAREKGFRTNEGDIILFSNSLNIINTASSFTKEQHAQKRFYDNGRIRVKGLTGDLLDLRLGKFTSIHMDEVKLATLKARVGEAGMEGASLTVDALNQIGFADLSVLGRSTIELLNPKIVKTHYNLSDSATVTLSGEVLRGINK